MIPGYNKCYIFTLEIYYSPGDVEVESSYSASLNTTELWYGTPFRGVVGRGREETASPTFFDRGDASPYFLRSLVNNMKARLFTTQSSNVSSLCDARSDACKQQYHDLIRQF